VSELFSSPTKSATSAAQAEQGITQSDINQAENYTATQQQNERSAISGLGSNPYFDAATDLSPSNDYVNPNDTTTFGGSGPGTTLAPVTTFSGGTPTAAAATERATAPAAARTTKNPV
jgi:hypothetical protein